MRAFRAALVAVCCLMPAAVPAQGARTVAVTGTVRDTATGAPLPGAVVRIMELHREGRTHEDGSFVIGAVPPGTYRLVVQRIGYRAADLPLVVADRPVTVAIALREQPMQVAATVITGQISERGSSDAITSTSVLSEARLDRRLDGTLGSTIVGTPGVAMAQMGPATGRPVIRGMGGDRVVILEDGQRPGDLSSTSMDHAVAIDPLTAQRIEVVRGPMSLLYGSSALGGVVNLIRHEVPTTAAEHAHGTLSAQASSANGGTTLGGWAEAPLAGLTVRGEGSFRNTGDLRTPVGVLGNTQSMLASGSVGASMVRDWGYAGVAYRFLGNEYGLPGGFVGAHPGGVDIAMRRHSVRAEADWHPTSPRVESVRATVTFSDYLHDEIEGDGEVATRYQQRMTVGEVVARHRPIGGVSSGAIGARAQYRDITTAGALRTPSTADWSLALFAIEEWGTGPLRLQAGARYDHARFTPLERSTIVINGEDVPTVARDFGALSASVGALYRFEHGIRLGASVSRAYRTPDFNELYSDGPHLAAYSYDVGNPRLRQETGLGAELFARVERDRVRAEAAVYVNRMDGYVFPRNTGELGRQGERWKFQYVNADARLAGAEGEFEWTLREHVVLEGTLSYVRGTITGSRDTIPGLNGEPDRVASGDLPLIPPLNGRIGLRHETARWSAGGGVRAAARQVCLGDFETPTAGYATVDLFLGRRFLVGGRLHGVTLRIDNLLDAEIRDHLSRTKLIIPDAGRNVLLLYRVQF
jgi:iron complex outermembrane receptor protein